mgnify:CR=1 FL=1
MGARLLLKLKRAGYLDARTYYGRLGLVYTGTPMGLLSEFGGINQLWGEMTYEKLDERYRNSLLMGLELAWEPVLTTMIAELVAFLDSSRCLWSTLYGVFSKVPLQGIAQPLATYLASSLRVIGSVAPYIGLALYLPAVVDGFSSS